MGRGRYMGQRLRMDSLIWRTVLLVTIDISLILGAATLADRMLAYDPPSVESDDGGGLDTFALPNVPTAIEIGSALSSPLFSTTREATPEPNQISPAAVSEPPRLPLFVGVILNGETGVVMLKDPDTQEQALIKEGEAFGEWTVTAIGLKNVTLQAGLFTVNLTLPAEALRYALPADGTPVSSVQAQE